MILLAGFYLSREHGRIYSIRNARIMDKISLINKVLRSLYSTGRTQFNQQRLKSCNKAKKKKELAKDIT